VYHLGREFGAGDREAIVLKELAVLARPGANLEQRGRALPLEEREEVVALGDLSVRDRAVLTGLCLAVIVLAQVNEVTIVQ
jgi:hypothetical protein